MLTGREVRTLESTRLERRARCKAANRARYARHMKRIEPRWGHGQIREWWHECAAITVAQWESLGGYNVRFDLRV